MNWGTCYSGSNNIHFDFPPLMSDGRNFSSWQPGNEISIQIREDNNIKTNSQYRNFLQNNADKIIKYNQYMACNQCCFCPTKIGKDPEQKNQPFLYKSCIQSTEPYGYESSDLKSLYLSEYQLQCRMYTPILTQDQLINGGFQNYN